MLPAAWVCAEANDSSKSGLDVLARAREGVDGLKVDTDAEGDY
jgi:hypothetical protein